MTMLPRDRVIETLAFRPPDILPLQIAPSPAGYYEHGQRLLDLVRRCGHDFGDAAAVHLPPRPGPEDFDAEGRYHKVLTDEWGTVWEFRIAGVWGHRLKYPLADWSALNTWRPPAVVALSGSELAEARAVATVHRERFFHVGNSEFVSLFETMQSLRPFEDVLIEVAADAPEINRLADLLVERNRTLIANSLAIGADAVIFGDDFGTQAGPMISPTAWRRFFKPRYRELMAPIVRQGRKILFHSCGRVEWLLEDLAEIGVSAVWPQLPLYDPAWLATRCRELGLAVQLQPDRGDLMQFAGPEQVRRSVGDLVETFLWRRGGSWLFIEIDPGFPWANVEALFEVAMELRP
jgi:hypothetical protein